MEEDTPRSHASPRDDRFYTPRTIARSNSASNSDEWQTPRYGYQSQSEGDFQTPRTYAHESDRKDMKAVYRNSSGIGYKDADLYPFSPAKSYYVSEVPRHGETKGNGRSQHDDHYQVKVSDDQDATAAAGVFSEEEVENLFRYTRHGRTEEIERSLSNGLPVDIRDEHGNTLLIIACQNGNKRVAKILLRRGANINARNLKGNTPLHYCYQYGYGESLGQYIISKGADPDARNNAGKVAWQGI